MKLNSSLEPGDYRIVHNTVYTQYYNLFQQLFAPPPVLDPVAIYYEEDGFRYELQDTERRFYETSYLLLTQREPYDPEVGWGKFLDENEFNELKIGRNERIILDFLENDVRRNHYLLAPVGTGKSTLLRYVLFYLVNRVPALRRTYWPIPLRLDDSESPRIIRHYKNGTLEEYFRGKLLRERIAPAIHSVTRLKNEAFWNYLAESYNSELRDEHEDLRDKYEDNLNEAWHDICDARRKARRHVDFPLAAVRYLAQSKGVIPVIVIDNLDQMGGEVCAALAQDLLSIRSNFQIKTIAAMRTATWKEVGKYLGSTTLNPDDRRLQVPDIREYTRHKSESLKHLLPSRPALATKAGHKVLFEDASRGLDAVTSTLLHPDCLDFLAAASQRNLRRWNILTEYYFQSGLLEEHADQVAGALSEAYAQKAEAGSSRIPLWIPFVSIMNRNHRTFFSPERTSDDSDVVVNVLCNGDHRHNSALVRLQVLSYMDRSKGVSAVRLLSDYVRLFDESDQQEAEKSLLHAVKRLVNCRMLDSTVRHLVREEDSAEDVGRLSLTSYGSLWLNRFYSTYEAIVYMKDDVWFPGEIPKGLRSCIESDNVRSRLRSTSIFLDYWFGVEKRFWRGLSQGSPDRKRHYMEKFVADRRRVLLVKDPTDHVQTFAVEWLHGQKIADERRMNSLAGQELEQARRDYERRCADGKRLSRSIKESARGLMSLWQPRRQGCDSGI